MRFSGSVPLAQHTASCFTMKPACKLESQDCRDCQKYSCVCVWVCVCVCKLMSDQLVGCLAESCNCQTHSLAKKLTLRPEKNTAGIFPSSIYATARNKFLLMLFYCIPLHFIHIYFISPALPLCPQCEGSGRQQRRSGVCCLTAC